MSKSRHIPISRSGIRDWCAKAFVRGMEAQADKIGTPQGVFDAWWEGIAGPDPKKPRRGAKP